MKCPLCHGSGFFVPEASVVELPIRIKNALIDRYGFRDWERAALHEPESTLRALRNVGPVAVEVIKQWRATKQQGAKNDV